MVHINQMAMTVIGDSYTRMIEKEGKVTEHREKNRFKITLSPPQGCSDAGCSDLRFLPFIALPRSSTAAVDCRV